LIKRIYKIVALIHKKGSLFFWLFAIVSWLLSIIGLTSISEVGFTPWTLVQALTLSFGDLPTDENAWLVFAKVFWMFTFTSAALSLFLKEWSAKQLFESIKSIPHTVIIGIDELSHNYISQLDKERTIILNNSKKISSTFFKDQHFAIKDVDIEEIENELVISNVQRIILNTGIDKVNIDIAFKIIDNYLKIYLNDIDKIVELPSLRLIVCVENRELNNLIMSSSIFSETKYKIAKIEFKIYSFFEECASSLFQNNYLDGQDSSIMKSNDEYAIAILGNGNLAKNIVYEAAKMAHLPNENILNIYLVSLNALEFKEEIIRSFPNIESIPTIKIHIKEINYKSINIYTDSLWDVNNLTNVIVCYDDETINLEISASLQNKTYLRRSTTKTKILFGVFNQGSISNRLDQDDTNFSLFKSFGDAKYILSAENMFDDKNHTTAKLINYTYNLLADSDGNVSYNADARFDYEKNSNEINNKWFKASYSDKTSSLAQAKHINMKLKILGLQGIKSNKSAKELLTINRKIIDQLFDNNYEGNYMFPENFEKSFDKMIRLEHNRWNSYHYLNGWIYSKDKDKDLKLHNCLMPLEFFPKYFKEDRLVELIEWDIYAFMYIPNYLSESGLEITIKESI